MDIEGIAGLTGQRVKAAAVRAAPPAKPKRYKRVLSPWSRRAGRGNSLVAAMEPGRWYDTGELWRMVDAPRGSRRSATRWLLKRGELERVINPEWRPGMRRGGNKGQRDLPCQWLWRLTEKGRERWRGLVLE